MNTKILIGGVVGVCLVVLIGYLVISPIATQGLNGTYEEEESMETEDIQVGVMSTKDELEVPDEVMEEVESESNIDTKPAVATETEVITPTPAPAPVDTAPATPTGYTLSDIALHSNATSCWTAIDGKVYDLTPFIKKHPGGSNNILRICGKDGTKSFEGQHGGQSRPENTLDGYYIGELQ